MTTARILILQAMCKQYRAPLFATMHQQLATHAIELRVAYSEPVDGHRSRNDNVDLPALYGLKVPGRSLFGGRLFSQLPLQAIARADLVIVEHALKHLINYPLLALSCCRAKKVAFWLHGGTLRHGPASLARSLRKQLLLTADWVFSYTEGVARDAIALGADPRHITPLQNAIDLTSFYAALAAVTEPDLAAARARLSLPPDASIALFCGSLYAGRGIDFLVSAGDRIAARDPAFHLIVLGTGPLLFQLQAEAAGRPWLHCLGSLFGDERAVYFRLAQVCLMPYLAGLGILDAMAAGLPYIVTGALATNPEIEYLVDHVTGLVTGDDVAAYADAVASLLHDPPRLHAMGEAARLASRQYSIENMASNFCRGIRQCLSEGGTL